MKEYEKYSVAIATYNGERFIAEMLNSILSQTRAVDELVISDDGSTDRTIELIRETTRNSQCKIVLIVNDRRLGFAKNFERALQNCTGDWIFLADQDDVWIESKVEVCERAIKRTQKDLIIHDCTISDKELREIFPSSMARYTELGIPISDRNIGCCMVVKRNFLEVCLPLPLNISHDIFIGAVANRTKGRELIDESLLLYRRHDNTVSEYLPDALKSIAWFTKTRFRIRIRLAENKRLLRFRSPENYRLMKNVEIEIDRRSRIISERIKN